MKKRMLAIMMSALMAAGICSGVTVYADADSKTLTVGFDAEYPPFGYMDESGEYVGFDLDVAQKVCDNLGWELVKKPINWDSKDMELNSGNIDCIWNGFTINGREDDYTWSDPYLNNEQVMVVTSDSGIETLADLAGKNVVVQAASAALDALNSEDNKELTDSFASLTENPDYNTAFMNIDSGAAMLLLLISELPNISWLREKRANIRFWTSRSRASSTALALPREMRSFVIPYGLRL